MAVPTDLEAQVAQIRSRVSQAQQLRARHEHAAEQAQAALAEVARQLEAEFGPAGTDYAAVLTDLDRQCGEQAAAVTAELDRAGL